MSGLKNFLHNSISELQGRANKSRQGLKERYLVMVKPSYSCENIENNNDEAEFFISQARWNASHITKGFTSKDEFKDDLKALILKPAILTFEAVIHGGGFVVKCMEALAHLVAALIEFFPAEPEESRHGFFSRINVFNRHSHQWVLPIDDLERAGDAALDAAESLVKLMIYPMIATVEFYVQSGSFVAKCLFSIDDSIGEKFNTAAHNLREAMPNVQFA